MAHMVVAVVVVGAVVVDVVVAVVNANDQDQDDTLARSLCVHDNCQKAMAKAVKVA